MYLGREDSRIGIAERENEDGARKGCSCVLGIPISDNHITRTHSRTLLSLTLSLAHTHSHSFTCTHCSLSLSHSQTLILTHTHSLSPSLFCHLYFFFTMPIRCNVAKSEGGTAYNRAREMATVSKINNQIL